MGRGWGGGERRHGGGRIILPEGMRRELDLRRKVPNSISIDFENFKEMPTSRELAQWLIEQELEPEKGIGVKRINRSEHDSRFYLQME